MDTEKIGAWKNNRLYVSKDMTRTQLIAIQRATSQFLKSKTSTKSGVYEVREETKKSLYRTLKLQDDNLTMADIDDFYIILGDADARPFLKTDVMGASGLKIAITDAVSYNDSETEFLDRMQTFADIADGELREKAKRLYNKYVKPKLIDLIDQEEEIELSKNFNLF